jgi:hypothetical protein
MCRNGVNTGLSMETYRRELPVCQSNSTLISLKKTKLHGLIPRANYTDRATAACRRSNCQLVRIEGATWSA